MGICAQNVQQNVRIFGKKNLSIYTQCYSNVISFQKMKFLGKRDKSDVYKKPVIYEVNTISDKGPGGSMS
jgi:hypothetical protein